ncbi:MAG TPA: flagellin FliC [Myxococcales bacterium]|nr:flagellin FliC [Myxococcales bacterium]HIN86656.1 flagellin FliC [Myxococcales bacterium]
MAGISLQTNVGSLNAQRQTNKTAINMRTAMQRLSSGFRINSAQDDAAGLGISERLRAQVRGLSQASRNANDGLSVVQTAEGVMGEVSDILIRMRELSVQSASDSVTSTERNYINTEFTELRSEIDRLVKSTKFNGQVLLDGSYTSKDFQVGFEKGDATDFVIQVSIANVNATGLAIASNTANTKTNAKASMTALDAALDSLNSARATLGAKGNRLLSAAAAVDVTRENLAAANSRIRDTDVAVETSNFSKTQVLMQAGVAMLSQANAQPQLALRLLG